MKFKGIAVDFNDDFLLGHIALHRDQFGYARKIDIKEAFRSITDHLVDFRWLVNNIYRNIVSFLLKGFSDRPFKRFVILEALVCNLWYSKLVNLVRYKSPCWRLIAVVRSVKNALSLSLVCLSYDTFLLLKSVSLADSGCLRLEFVLINCLGARIHKTFSCSLSLYARGG